jgi:hypothetical protein
MFDRGAQAAVCGGARCASQVLDRGAKAGDRGPAHLLDRGVQAISRGAARYGPLPAAALVLRRRAVLT